MEVASATMGRPKKTSDKAPENSGAKTIGMRVSGGYAEWIERLAKHQRTTLASLIDRALADHARNVGFDDPPPDRMS